jgi:hypothetical protein
LKEYRIEMPAARQSPEKLTEVPLNTLPDFEDNFIDGLMLP